jgi:energy-coupling factor transporter transmembrane protein EcfT
MTKPKTISLLLIIIGFCLSVWSMQIILYGVLFFLAGITLDFFIERPLWIHLLFLLLPLILWQPVMLQVRNIKLNRISQKDSYLFPKGFRGEALIAFGINKGQALQTENGRRIFNFDTSGVLITQAPITEGISNQEFFYRDNQGKLIPLATGDFYANQNAALQQDSIHVKVFGAGEIATMFGQHCSYKYFLLKVCTMAQLDSVDADFKTFRLHDKVKKFACIK